MSLEEMWTKTCLGIERRYTAVMNVRRLGFCLGYKAASELARVGAIALDEANNGTRKLDTKPGVMFKDRFLASARGHRLINRLESEGILVHRARVKTPQSIELNKTTKKAPNDLLGLQVHGKGPEDVAKVKNALEEAGVKKLRANVHLTPAYNSVHVKGEFNKTPVEVQIHPSRATTLGHVLQHSLVYRPEIEAPNATPQDRILGEAISRALVSKTSWIPSSITRLKGLGMKLEFKK